MLQRAHLFLEYHHQSVQGLIFHLIDKLTHGRKTFTGPKKYFNFWADSDFFICLLDRLILQVPDSGC